MNLLCGTWMLALLFAGIYVLIDAIGHRHKLFAAFSAMHVITCYFMVQQMIEAVKNGSLTSGIFLPLAVISIITGVMITIMYIWRTRNVSILSIKEGIDALSDGLCYYYRDGRVKLVNPAMNMIAKDLIGQSVTDGRVLQDAVAACKDKIIRTNDGSIYRMISSEKDFLREPVIELIASDITDEYELREKLRERKSYLEGQRRRLMEVNDSITDLTIEKEILRTKIGIHDDLGKTLVTIRSYFAGTTSKEKLLSVFDRGISLMDSPGTGKRRDDYAAVLKAAADVGINVIINGQLPAGGYDAYVVSAAMRECITNTLRHANGDELTIDVTSNKHGETTVTFTNNGKPPEGEIKETGGLSYLRGIAVQRGADMTIESTPRFVLKLTLLGIRDDLL